MCGDFARFCREIALTGAKSPPSARKGKAVVATRIPLTLACGDYEIIRPLKEGTVRPDGIDLTVLTAMDSTTRHWRFLRGFEFDMAEVSCSSYKLAATRGLPRMRFRFSCTAASGTVSFSSTAAQASGSRPT
jgi:hypothetical protein